MVGIVEKNAMTVALLELLSEARELGTKQVEAIEALEKRNLDEAAALAVRVTDEGRAIRERFERQEVPALAHKFEIEFNEKPLFNAGEGREAFKKRVQSAFDELSAQAALEVAWPEERGMLEAEAIAERFVAERAQLEEAHEAERQALAARIRERVEAFENQHGEPHVRALVHELKGQLAAPPN